MASITRDGAEIFFNPTVVGKLVHELEQAFVFQVGQEIMVRECAVARADRLPERFRIREVLDEMHQLSIVDQRQHHRTRSAAFVHDELAGFQCRGHGATSLACGCVDVKRLTEAIRR